MNKLTISEMFESIQGEGRFAGAPSLFVRTSGCNLRCWWCDTPYTSWRPEGQEQTVEEVGRRIADSRSPHVVITGGEPMLHAEAVRELVFFAVALGRHVTVETNGTLYPSWAANVGLLWSVSPKLISSAPSEMKHHQEWLSHLESMAMDERFATLPPFWVQFKFVATDCDRDVDEVRRFVERHKLSKHVVFLMPQARTGDKVLELGRQLAEVCKKEHWNLCLRQHVLLWGNRRGA